MFEDRKNEVLHAITWKSGKIMAIKQPFHLVTRWSSVTSGRVGWQGWGAARPCSLAAHSVRGPGWGLHGCTDGTARWGGGLLSRGGCLTTPASPLQKNP